MAALKPPQTSPEKPRGRTQIPWATLITAHLSYVGAFVTPKYSWLGTDQWPQACLVLALCWREGEQGGAPGSPPSGTPWKAWEVVPLRPAVEIGLVLSSLGAEPQEGLGLA